MGGEGEGEGEGEGGYVVPLSVAEGESNPVVSRTGGEGVEVVFMRVICVLSDGDVATSVPPGGGEDVLGRGGVCGVFDVSVSANPTTEAAFAE